jgi:hypothetical protein
MGLQSLHTLIRSNAAHQQPDLSDAEGVDRAQWRQRACMQDGKVAT